MEIQITGHQFDVTDAITQLIENKMAKLGKHHPKISHLHVVLEVNHLDHLAKARLVVPGSEINAKCSSDDMYKSIDELVEKLIKLLEKHKGKH